MTEEYHLPEVYHFDESKLPELRERLKWKLWKVILPTFFGIVALEIVVSGMKDIALLSFLIVSMLILTALSMNSALKKAINLYKEYHLVINDKRITSTFRIEKEIEWKYAKLKVSDSGEITIINLKLNWLKRLYDEHGRIVIPPELENYEKLKLLLFKRAKPN